MDPKGQSLLKLLFNEGETVCVSSDKYPYHSIPLEKAMDGEIELIPEKPGCPNNLVLSSDLIMVAINPMEGFRKDESTTKFRTFLWEIDKGSIKEQLGYLKHIGVPLSASIFSGNKSIHALTVLDEDIPDEKTYRLLYNWALNILTMCDQNCKNPSRSTRIPGAYREPGKKQRLFDIGTRVKFKDFMDWLNKYEHLRPQIREKKIIPSDEPDFDRLSIWAKIQLTKGIDFKNRGRNVTFHGLAYDLALAGFSEDGIIEILLQRFTEESDFKEKELRLTIKSAFRRVNEGK